MIDSQEQIKRLNAMKNSIDEQIAHWQNIPQQPTILQNFITAPIINDFDARWVESYEDVKASVVTKETIFMERNENVFHIKTPSGELKSFQFQEYEYLDAKDKKIKELEEKLSKLEHSISKGDDNSAKSNIKLDEQKNADESIKDTKSSESN